MIIWGRDAVETEELLIERHTRKKSPRVACIGPAGEKPVPDFRNFK
jgi:aldehyde:ferredoxin oxidoreductase